MNLNKIIFIIIKFIFKILSIVFSIILIYYLKKLNIYNISFFFVKNTSSADILYYFDNFYITSFLVTLLKYFILVSNPFLDIDVFAYESVFIDLKEKFSLINLFYLFFFAKLSPFFYNKIFISLLELRDLDEDISKIIPAKSSNNSTLDNNVILISALLSLFIIGTCLNLGFIQRLLTFNIDADVDRRTNRRANNENPENEP